MIIVHVLSTALAEKGHNVTVVSPFPLNTPVDNHREIPIVLSDKTKSQVLGFVQESSKHFSSTVSYMVEKSYNTAVDIMTSDSFKEILNENFDLLVIGMNFQNYLLGFGEHFDCPVIILSVQRHFSYSNLLIGNPMSISSVPHYFISKSELNFVDKLKSFLLYGMDLFLHEYMTYHQKNIYSKYFPSPPYRSYDDAVSNISLMLVNDHFSDGQVRPNIPAVVDIRGIQVKLVPDKLPDELQKFLDNATNGAIYFSLGSNVKPEFVSNETLKNILTTFSNLSQKVIMKWDNEEIVGKSGNILVKKWLPQDDILAHPNMKLFISHCGLGGIVESKYHGVPILGLPMFGDQMMNANLAVEEGWALQMELKTLTEVDFYKTIQKMIHHETYSATAKSFSRVYRDRPLSARDTAVYWTEYVINHRGAKHLQHAAVHQNFWQRNSLDVIGFLLLCLYVIMKVLKLIFIFIIKIVIKTLKRKCSMVDTKKNQ